MLSVSLNKTFPSFLPVSRTVLCVHVNNFVSESKVTCIFYSFQFEWNTMVFTGKDSVAIFKVEVKHITEVYTL